MVIEKIPIVEMEDDHDDVSSVIVRLPYIDIADIVSWIEVNEPLAVIPPYSADAGFTARAASMVKDRLLAPRSRPVVLVACPGERRVSILGFLRAMAEQGFAAFAISKEIGDVPLEHLFPVAPDGMWIHVAGGKPRVSLAGRWTWSEEGL